MHRSAAVRVSVLASFVLCLAFTSTTASVGQTQETKIDDTKIDDSKIDPRAEAIFRQFAETVAGLKNYRVDLDFSMTNQAGEVRVKLDSKYQATLQPPNKFILTPGDETNGMHFTSDGTHQFVYLPRTSSYTNSEAPANINLLARAVMENYGPLRDPAPMMFAELLLEGDIYEVLMLDVEELQYLGTTDLDGQDVHHIRQVEIDGNIDTWFTTGDATLMKRFQMTASEAGGAEPSMTMALTLDNWTTTDDNLDDSVFQFTPPPGAEAVAAFTPPPGGYGNPPGLRIERRMHPLVGKMAPGFKLDSLEGGQVDLAQHRGKDIVILDFWATWCGPCIQAMPMLIEVAGKYKDKGVVFYGMNIAEDNATVQRFLRQRGFELNVVMDRNGQASKDYQAASIPQTVIVGKDGTVKVVHVGFNPSLGPQLSRELDALIAGEDVAR